jgi:uncharacterized protein (TIGR03435 family)
MMRAALILAFVGGVAALVAQAPAEAPPAPAFDVASIARSPAGTRGSSSGLRPGGWSMVNGSTLTLIRSAYPSPVSDLIGAPEWVTDQRYDVTATARGNPTREEVMLMLRALLADRFKLALHYETQERNVFALVLARGDGRLGPGLRRSNIDCEAVNAPRRDGVEPGGPLPADGAEPCTWSSDGTSIRFGGLPLSRLPEALVYPAGRVVIDETGLTGNYEFTLRYSSQPSPATEAATIFTALEDQLGLRLKPDFAALQVLVIDSVERPTPDGRAQDPPRETAFNPARR